MTSLSLCPLTGLMENIESFPLWTRSARPPDQGRGWVGKVPLVKDLGFETIDEKLRGGAHPLCNHSGPLIILGLAFSRNGLRTKYPASGPSHSISLSARSLPDVHLNLASPFRQAGRLRSQWDTCPGLYGNSTPSNVRTALDSNVPRTSHAGRVWTLPTCRAQGPGPRPPLPPASPPACLLPITLRRRG